MPDNTRVPLVLIWYKGVKGVKGVSSTITVHRTSTTKEKPREYITRLSLFCGK